ncbi:conserved protein of unknown function [Acidithiobacillus ferrivorans]|uniref:Roadblock/LC7 domain-containing protein n=1 Tax=Acidithiobacillus ferrivorans TaxID=160808 RepID=A0A060UTD7_9PROT|nr:roadblock/LC7 domain-containing protein [Acidithiobacillus ferrivorans]MBN6739724.1 roadblock/LC7 domain-containing protein [Acidithiobacillus sp. MC6.1]OCB03045.1 hypothetical protein BBC27_09775 [Acidithiobacillus ferrivorans]QQD73431.1 roadblock/LC7 domain-containing protein [Acidithiobacillus ferrivorans]CDQ10028.1 conserved hypothetical protein [Acidithiobacillus ferrivorans]SMH65606.1 conserved protein of unknown function [Acidithiobacillus ferrivorans]
MSIELVATSADLYGEVTPAGAFYATSSPDQEGNRAILLYILREGHRAPFSIKAAQRWTQAANAEEALRSIFRLQRLGLLRGTEHPRQQEDKRLEDALPPLLAQLSDVHKTLLADENGFYLAAAGYTHEAAEELAGLSADLLSLQARHGRLLKNNLRINTETWGLLDPAGRSELGFWPLFIGQQRFMLVVSGTPRLQDQSFVTLVQDLGNRYF